MHASFASSWSHSTVVLVQFNFKFVFCNRIKNEAGLIVTFEVLLVKTIIFIVFFFILLGAILVKYSLKLFQQKFWNFLLVLSTNSVFHNIIEFCLYFVNWSS